MNNKIYLSELNCFKNASKTEKEHPLLKYNRCFDLGKLNNNRIKEELREFILHRGTVLSPWSIKSEIYPFNQLCEFLEEMYPELTTFQGLDFELTKKKLRSWLLKNGKNILQESVRTSTGKREKSDADVIKYLRKIIKYYNKEDKTFCYERDIWYLEGIPILLRENPTRKVRSINFSKIKQDKMRREIKEIIFVSLTQKAIGTVLCEMTAINRFSAFLTKQYPDVMSLRDVNRKIIEDYLIHTNTEAKGRKSYSKDLYNLSTVLCLAANILEEERLNGIISGSDIGSEPQFIFKAYSEKELERLNKAILDMDEQIVRVLVLHQMMGTRISDTLSLRQDALYLNKDNQWEIQITQIKTNHTYTVPLSDTGKKIFDKACSYTNKKFGKQKYVFVNEENPSMPMQYGKIQYHMMKMNTEKQLVDDNGEPFGVGTHIFRHSFGKMLTEKDIDDVLIAKLLGHKSTRNLMHYRKNGEKRLKEATQRYRKDMNEIIRNIVSDWDN